MRMVNEVAPPLAASCDGPRGVGPGLTLSNWLLGRPNPILNTGFPRIEERQVREWPAQSDLHMFRTKNMQRSEGQSIIPSRVQHTWFLRAPTRSITMQLSSDRHTMPGFQLSACDGLHVCVHSGCCL